MIDFHQKRALEILKKSEQIFTPKQVQNAVTRVAKELNERFVTTDKDSFPLVLGVMGGAVIFTGQLLPQLTFPLEFDFIHVSRYGNDEQGGEIVWKVIPRQNVMNRVVVVLDDILDEGQTLEQIQKKLLEMGAQKVVLAVFSDKANGVNKPVKADHVGLVVPNKFVIGFGMDINGYWRNLPDIRVVPPEIQKS